MSSEGTLAQKAYSRLREKLSQGSLPPGARLVNRTLAAELGLSMTPVREAINRLASEGLVEFVPGAGAYVRKLSPRDLAQIYELRELLEPYAAAQAAQRASPADVQELAALAAEGTELGRKLAASDTAKSSATLATLWHEMEARFHLAIFRAAGNDWLLRVVSSLRLLERVFVVHRSLRTQLLTPEVTHSTTHEHAQLCQAITQRDAAAAESLMRQHIQQGKRHVLELLEAQQTGRSSAARRVSSNSHGV